MLIDREKAIAIIEKNALGMSWSESPSESGAGFELLKRAEALRALPVSDGVTDEMVERAARAMAIADKKDPDADFRMQGDVFLTVATDTPQIWRTYARKARAALEAALGATVSDGWEDIAIAKFGKLDD